VKKGKRGRGLKRRRNQEVLQEKKIKVKGGCENKKTC
jgi:hypothetical protein